MISANTRNMLSPIQIVPIPSLLHLHHRSTNLLIYLQLLDWSYKLVEIVVHLV